MHLIGVYDYTVILTYISLVSSLVGMVNAYQDRFSLAVCLLMLSGFGDMFDGIVARSKKDRTADEKSFGIQLDSLNDVICFGVFPAVLLYFRGVTTAIGIAALVVYVLCALIRLAFFNVMETNRQMTEDGCAKEYHGLPVTMSAVILPLFFAIGSLLPQTVSLVIYHVLPLAVGFLFVLDFRVPKIDFAKLFKERKSHKTAV